MSTRILGLDIGQGSVSAVLLRSSRKGHIIEGTTQVPLADNEEGEALSTALESIVHNLNAANTICVASLPPHHAFIRNLQVPFHNPKKINQILPLELESSLPMPSTDLAIGFLDLPQQTDSGQHHILTAAIPRETLQAFLDPLNACQVKVECLTLRAFPLAELLSADQTLAPDWLLVDLDGPWCTLIVTHQRRVCFMRAFAIAPEHVSDPTKLSRAIEHSLIGIENQLPFRLQPQVVWIEGFEPFAGLRQTLAQTLALPVHAVDGPHGPTLLQTLSRPKAGDRPAVGVHARALALLPANARAKLNYCKGTWRRHWNRDLKKSVLYRAAALILLIILAGANLGIEFYDLKMQRAHLVSQIERTFKATFPEVTRIVDPVQQMRVSLQQMRQDAFSQGEHLANQRKIDLLLDLSRKIPGQLGIQIQRLFIGPEQVRLSGTAASFNAVNEMQSSLETLTAFAKVQINSATIDKRTKRVRFQIGMTMAPTDQRL